MLFRALQWSASAFVAFALASAASREIAPSLAAQGAPAAVPLRAAHADLPGVRLWYRDSGGTGEPVVFLHAGTGFSGVWEHQIPAFTKAGYRFIAYDRRGFGQSTEVPGGPSPGTGADDLNALMDHLKIGRFHLVGTAAGGFVALDYAVSFPKRLRSLVFANSMGLIQDEEFQEFGRRIRPKEFAALPQDFKELSPSYRAKDPEGVRRWVEFEHTNRPAGAKPVNQAYRHKMTYALLQTITAPTLLIAGESDPYMPPPVMREIAKRIKNSRGVVIPETSHSAFWEAPELFNKHILTFLSKY